MLCFLPHHHQFPWPHILRITLSPAASDLQSMADARLLLAISALLSPLLLTAAFDYRDALSKSLLYFEAQRSGRLPHSQRAAWRHHSGLTDGLQQGVDLVGGYYDAGDHVKFGLPMAFTVTMLSWSVAEYGEEIAAAGELRHALEAIKWGTDYFIKAHTHPDVLWAEVGDGESDHYCWQRSEDMTTPRQAYKISPERPGSDLAGETAAAMAAASIVFRKFDSHYSHLLLHHAEQLFEFGARHTGEYDASVGAVKGYYASVSGYRDELLWAALWLQMATGRREYMEYAVDNAVAFGGTEWAMSEFSWDVKYAGLQVLASRLLLLKEEPLSKRHQHVLKEYKSKAEHYICSCLNKNNGSNSNVLRTPGGLLYTRPWNNMQYVSTASFLLTIYSDYLQSSSQNQLHCQGGAVHPVDLLALAKAQADYILGNNPLRISYLVGFGHRYPTKVHHRGASIKSYKENKGFIGCTQGYDEWYSSPKANPNVIIGALVGGPGLNDEFMDERGNYMQTEACTYNTAPMVGVFARLHWLHQKNRPISMKPGNQDDSRWHQIKMVKHRTSN